MASTEAQASLGNLQAVLNGLAGITSKDDGPEQNRCLNASEQSSLFFSLADQLATIRAHFEIADLANERRKHSDFFKIANEIKNTPKLQ